MNSQDRQRIQELIDRAQEEPQVIRLEDYDVVMFRNIYNEATIAGLTVTIVERGKVFQIGKDNGKNQH
jgi:hypothetical protein